jgi:hypothetical protein
MKFRGSHSPAAEAIQSSMEIPLACQRNVLERFPPTLIHAIGRRTARDSNTRKPEKLNRGSSSVLRFSSAVTSLLSLSKLMFSLFG